MSQSDPIFRSGYVTVPTPSGGEDVLVMKGSVSSFAEVDTLIFDLDGVIIDPTDSIQKSHPISLKYWAENIRGLSNCDNLITDPDVDAFKLAGGFNDDWNIASAAALLYSIKAEALGTNNGQELLKLEPTLQTAASGSSDFGGGVEGIIQFLQEFTDPECFDRGVELWDSNLVMQVFKEVVSGPLCPEMYGFVPKYYTGLGQIYGDRLLADKSILKMPYAQAIFTGRTLGEAHVGLRLLGLEDWIPDTRIISVDDGMPKPDGRPLAILAEKLGTKVGAFIGDNPDDLKSVIFYRQMQGPPILAINITFGTAKEEVKKIFMSGGSDMIAPDVNSALEALRILKEGAEA